MKKFFIKPMSFVLVLFVLFGVFIFPTAAEGMETSGIIDGQVYSIVNVNSGKALDVSAGNTADNSDISQYTPTPSTYWQEWRIRYVGSGEYTIEDMHSRKFVTNVSNNAAIYTENNTSSQRFRIVNNNDGTYTFLSKSSNYNKALGAYNAGTSNGETVVFIDVDGSNNQKYYLDLSEEYGIINERVYSFVNLGNNEAIDVDSGNTAPGSWIGNYTYYHDTPWQRWKVTYVGNGDYEIMDMHSGLLLSIPGSSASQTNAWLYPDDNTDGQKFRFQRNTDGTVTIFSKSSDYKMALGWNGGALAQLPEDNSANQKFNIVLPGYVYNIQNVRSEKSLDSTNNGVTDGTMVTQFTTSPDPQQQWLFCYIGNGEYKIINMYNGKLLNIYADSTDENAPACLWYDTGSSGQKFKLIHNGDGSITLLNGATNYQKALCIYSADGGQGLANGDSVVQQTYNSNDNNQKFYINVESTAMLPEGKYLLKSANSLKYMQDNTDSIFVKVQDLSGKLAQAWQFEYYDSGRYRIKNLSSNEYLTSNAVNMDQKELFLYGLQSEPYINRQLWVISVHEYGEIQIRSYDNICQGGDSLYVAIGEKDNIIEQRTDISTARWIFNRTTGTELRKQDTETFCWLASSEMLTETYGYDNYSQHDIFNEYFPQTNGGTIHQIKQASEYYTDNELTFRANSFEIYSQKLIRQHIDDGNPIVITRGWYDDSFVRTGGHATIIIGYYYDTLYNGYKYIINDPWALGQDLPYEGSCYVRTYAFLKKGTLETAENCGYADNGIWESVAVINSNYAQITISNNYLLNY